MLWAVVVIVVFVLVALVNGDWNKSKTLLQKLQQRNEETFIDSFMLVDWRTGRKVRNSAKTCPQRTSEIDWSEFCFVRDLEHFSQN